MNHPFRIIAPPEVPPEDLDAALPEAPDQAAETRPEVDPEEAARAAQRAAAEEAREREALRARARDEGYAEGHRQGRAEALKAVEASVMDTVERLENGLDRLMAERETREAEMLQAAIRIGRTLAETLVAAPRPFDRHDLLRKILAEARAAARNELPRLVCRASDGTLAELAPHLPEGMETEADETMQPGGFIIALTDQDTGAPATRWDASIERIQQVLRYLPAGE